MMDSMDTLDTHFIKERVDMRIDQARQAAVHDNVDLSKTILRSVLKVNLAWLLAIWIWCDMVIGLVIYLAMVIATVVRCILAMPFRRPISLYSSFRY